MSYHSRAGSPRVQLVSRPVRGRALGVTTPYTCPPGQYWSDGARQCVNTPPFTPHYSTKDCPADQIWSEPAQQCLNRCNQPGTHWDDASQTCAFASSDGNAKQITDSTDPTDKVQVFQDAAPCPSGQAPDSRGVCIDQVSYLPPDPNKPKPDPNPPNPNPPTPTAAKDNTALYVGGGLAVLALLGVAYYMSTKKK